MSEVNGVRFGRRDKKNRIKVLLPGGAKLLINGAEVTLRTSAVAFVESHEDANKVLGVTSGDTQVTDKNDHAQTEKSEEALDNSEE